MYSRSEYPHTETNGDTVLDGDREASHAEAKKLLELGPYVCQALAGIRHFSLGWTQERLAERVAADLAASSNPNLSSISCDNTYISKMERGKQTLTVNLLLAICQAMDVGVEKVMAYADALRSFSEETNVEKKNRLILEAAKAARSQ